MASSSRKKPSPRSAKPPSKARPAKPAPKAVPKPPAKARAPAPPPKKSPSKAPSPARTAASAGPAATPPPEPRRGDGRRHLLSLSFLRDGDEFLARLETDAGQITELKNRSLDQLLSLVAGELEDLLV